ncbi:hypothetical protein [Halorubrum laminariae]|uniref:Uncharacterized protein n=1 Tax=Halorubrum laminariae TaxID=1433523 RepID=A0ABD6C254_9EURY|nr:hypothetical protein [Halorubrum laminariae]
MLSTLRRALRGTLAAVSLLAFVALFFALHARVTSLPILLGLLAVGTGALLGAGGRPALRELLGRGGSPASGDPRLSERTDDAWTDRNDRGDSESDPDWPLARLEPALDDAWNQWADAVLTVGLAAIGVGSFGLLIANPGEEPPLGLLVSGLFGINGALVSLAFALKSGEG